MYWVDGKGTSGCRPFNGCRCLASSQLLHTSTKRFTKFRPRLAISVVVFSSEALVPHPISTRYRVPPCPHPLVSPPLFSASEVRYRPKSDQLNGWCPPSVFLLFPHFYSQHSSFLGLGVFKTNFELIIVRQMPIPTLQRTKVVSEDGNVWFRLESDGAMRDRLREFSRSIFEVVQRLEFGWFEVNVFPALNFISSSSNLLNHGRFFESFNP